MRQMNEYSLDALIVKSYKQLNYSDSIDILLSERKLDLLLTEEIGQSELESLENLAKDAKDSLVKLKDDANSLGLTNAVTYMDNLLEELPDTPDLVAVAIEQDAKKAAKQIGQVASATKKANAFRDSYTRAVSLFGDNLAKLDLPDTVDKTKALKDLADGSTEGFPELDKLETGAQAAYQPPPPGKGIFKKIASFFGFGADFTKEQFTEDILASSLDGIVKKAQELKGEQPEAGSDEEESDSATAGLEDELETLAGGDDSALNVPSGEGDTPKEGETSDAEIEATAEEVAAEVGSSISKAELTALLKRYPEITGKGPAATRQRRIFRKAINKVAGKEVFEEAKKYKTTEYSEKEMLVYRLNKLAGLE